MRTALATRLRRLPGRSGPSCSLVGDQQGQPEDGTAATRLRAVHSSARRLLLALAAVHRPRFLARPVKAVKRTPAGPGRYERPLGRRRPDARP